MLTEKNQIELATAEGFLNLYNQFFGSTYAVVQRSDAPDILCEDSNGRKLNLEITSTEDESRDIQAQLGRSDHRSLEALEEHNDRVAAGLEAPRFTSFENAMGNLVTRIREKLKKDYGAECALVVRDSSGLDWEWNEVADQIASELCGDRNPFERGIWVLSRAKDKLYEIVSHAN